MLQKELKPLLDQAVNSLFARDTAVLENSEWAIAHRLAVYLEPLLPGWNIDCEFNRQGEKTTSGPKMAADGSRVRPDIIVHHRGRVEREHNLLAIELKKRANSSRDHEKVKDYTAAANENRKFQYQHGVTISLEPLKMTWFYDGEKGNTQ